MLSGNRLWSPGIGDFVLSRCLGHQLWVVLE